MAKKGKAMEAGGLIAAPRQTPRNPMGRPRMEHPFRELAELVVGKTIDGRPAAVPFPFTLVEGGDSLATLRNRFRRQLTRLGKELRPEAPITFPTRVEPGARPGEYVLYFWDQGAGK